MEVKFEISDEEFAKLRPSFKRKFGIDDVEIPNKLNHLARTSFLEYTDMITDIGIPSKVADIIQERLLLLIENYYEDIPNEIEISRMFNITTNRSRTILNNIKSIHRNRINDRLELALKEFIDSGQPIDNNTKYEYVVKSKPLMQELNEIIMVEKPGLDKFSQKINCAGKFVISKDTYDFLKTKFQ